MSLDHLCLVVLVPPPCGEGNLQVSTGVLQVWVKHAEVADASQLFFELPHKLRQEIAWELNRAVFEQVPFLE